MISWWGGEGGDSAGLGEASVRRWGLSRDSSEAGRKLRAKRREGAGALGQEWAWHVGEQRRPMWPGHNAVAQGRPGPEHVDAGSFCNESEFYSKREKSLAWLKYTEMRLFAKRFVLGDSKLGRPPLSCCLPTKIGTPEADACPVQCLSRRWQPPGVISSGESTEN